ncbi:unnamed protein product [Caenorhabditis bovis]|uniref:Protein LTV1 homolog n=1 Tax=Caenorhabditis bovis TaxID=2654633 RepID=A0A8S1F7L9_9PELO|nr:unnamed protein product [Caenorhabditis bovis]
MGKKKVFIDRKNAQHFRLVPDTRERSERFKPTPEHLEEQQKYGVFYDDDYDYLQHLRAINEPMKLQDVNEEVERVTIKAQKPTFPPAPPVFGLVGNSKSAEFHDEEVEKALEGEGVADGVLEDNFIELAGGVIDDRMTAFRDRSFFEDDHTDDDDDDDEEIGDNEKGYTFEDDEVYPEHEKRLTREEMREMDEIFEQVMDAEYNEDQIGELDGDDYDVGGCLEPSGGRLHQLVNDAASFRNTEDEDKEIAKRYTLERMRLIEEGKLKEKEEMEIVEVDDSRKRMKWDCESFATQYTNIYNHPTLIRDNKASLSKNALRKFDKQIEQMDIAEEEEEEDEDCEMEDDASDFTTVSTIRPKGETPEQRRLRKAAVKEARRARREEKKANKTAFAVESRKLAKGRIGQIKARPV